MTVAIPHVDRRAFSEVSEVRPVGPGRFDAEVDPEWTIGGRPNGGYLLAMLGRAATWSSTHPHVIAASAHYLRSPEPGPIAIETETLRTGRSVTQVRARMTQGEIACVEAVLTSSRLERDTRSYWDAGLPKVSPVGWEECERLVPVLPTGQPRADHGTGRSSHRTGHERVYQGPAERSRGTARVAGSAGRRRFRPQLAPVRDRCLPPGYL